MELVDRHVPHGVLIGILSKIVRREARFDSDPAEEGLGVGASVTSIVCESDD